MKNYLKYLILTLFISANSNFLLAQSNNSINDSYQAEIGIGMQYGVPGIHLGLLKNKFIGVYAHMYSEKLLDFDLEEFESRINIGLNYTIMHSERIGSAPYLGYSWGRIYDISDIEYTSFDGLSFGLKSLRMGERGGWVLSVGLISVGFGQSLELEAGVSYVFNFNIF